MFAACTPFGPRFVSKLTFWPSARLLKPSPRISEKCANRSSPPLSGEMKPKPFASLNHLTVPVSIRILETEKLKRLSLQSLEPKDQGGRGQRIPPRGNGTIDEQQSNFLNFGAH